MTRRVTVLAIATVCMAASGARAVEVPVDYLVDARAFSSSVRNGDSLTFELYSDSACTNLVDSESITAGSAALLVEQVKPKKLSGQSPSPAKGLRLGTVLNPSGLQDQFWLQVTGVGIVPIGNACEPLPPSPLGVPLGGIGNDQLAANAVTTDKILDGAVTAADIGNGQVANGKLANSSLTVNAGTGLAGGGTVDLGGSTTLSNAGVLSVGASAPLSSSGGQNPNVSLSGVVPVANGGTGASTTSEALSNLGAAASGANSDIASLSGLTGNISLPHSTDAYTGNMLKGGVPFLHNFPGSPGANVFLGLGAGNFSMTGTGNTAMGHGVFSANTTGGSNTAVGFIALASNTTGNSNTAIGGGALGANTIASNNTAVGVAALAACTSDGNNTAVGTVAASHTNAPYNTAVGQAALFSNTIGVNNIALGDHAGSSLTTGDNNIDIGNWGLAAEANTIRIGTAGTQIAAYIAGINGATSGSGVPVYVNSSGQLGTATSSARFKRDIRDMGDATSGLMQLRPVRFRYKPEIDSSGLEQYGLVAEEVAKVYPDLVVYDDHGQPQTVRYHFINAMLLNEVQKQHRRLEDLAEANARLQRTNGGLQSRIEYLEKAVGTIQAAMRSADAGALNVERVNFR